MKFKEQLAASLAELISGHGIECEVRADQVLIPRTNTSMSLMVVQEYPNGTVLMGCSASRKGQPDVRDLWAGLGANTTDSVKQGLAAFCLQDFHVLLATHCGLLETDQVEHEVFMRDGSSWDLYTGALVGRSSEHGAIQLTLDWAALVRTISHVVSRQIHALRLFVSVSNGEVTYEALLDGEECPDLLQLLQEAPMKAPEQGYGSQRLFACAALRASGQPAHSAQGVCQP